MPTTKNPSRVTQELLEMADDMHSLGIMADATHQTITVFFHLDRTPLPSEAPTTSAPCGSARI